MGLEMQFAQPSASQAWMAISPTNAAPNNIGMRDSSVWARRIAATGTRGRGPVVTRLARSIAAVCPLFTNPIPSLSS